MTILVVDDSDTMRLLIKRDLRLAGWDDVADVGDVRAAIEAIDQHPVELVLADWNMPGGGGLELLREMRRRNSPAGIGFVTCEASGELRAEALRAGAQFLLTKPVEGEVLDRHVRLAMGMAAPPLEAPGRERSLSMAEVLSMLFQRDVSVAASVEPRRELPCVAAHYDRRPAGPAGIDAVVEMTLAAALGCALARVPPRQAEQWSGAHVLSGAVEDGFVEVANVMATVVSPAGERYGLEGISYLEESRHPDHPGRAEEWTAAVEVSVDGYQSGRLGWQRRITA